MALASCAYHNVSGGFKLPSKKTNYYTFSDFFIQSKEEIPPQGIKIRYKILYDNWRPSKNLPEGKGIGAQVRIKKTGGKWNEYSARVKRNVVFLGIERVVPYAEKNVYKNYRSYFKKRETLGWEIQVKDTVGRILGKFTMIFGLLNMENTEYLWSKPENIFILDLIWVLVKTHYLKYSQLFMDVQKGY